MLDTDISIYTIKRKPPEVRRMFNIHAGEICISTATLGELIYGAEKSENSRANLESIKGFEIMRMLLRQYLPKKTNLSVYIQKQLDLIAKELNERSQKNIELFITYGEDLSGVAMSG